MSIEIKTAAIEPIRQTYGHIARRFGEKPATRYQEATYDLQATTNFHYKLLWQEGKDLNDKTHTAIVMEDWYAFRDPRQFYYGAYVQNRARMQEGAEHNYAFFAKRNSAEVIPEITKQAIITALLPLRHVEQTANLNCLSGSAYGYGTAITQACLYAGMDRLGMAQYLSRMGLLLDGNSGDSLIEAKTQWMDNPAWQGMRALCEKMLVQKDWFEMLLVQLLILDTYIATVSYQAFDTWLNDNGGRDIGMLTEFMQDDLKDLRNWSDSVFKIAVAESEENKAQLNAWLSAWVPVVANAYQAVAEQALGENASVALENAQAELAKRCKKVGLTLSGE